MEKEFMKDKKKANQAVGGANKANSQYSKSAVPEERTTKSEANRKNALKSPGPTTPRGKSYSRNNALKDGLFSKEVVVTAAGERVENFKRFEAWVWDSRSEEHTSELQSLRHLV